MLLRARRDTWMTTRLAPGQTASCVRYGGARTYAQKGHAHALAHDEFPRPSRARCSSSPRKARAAGEPLASERSAGRRAPQQRTSEQPAEHSRVDAPNACGGRLSGEPACAHLDNDARTAPSPAPEPAGETGFPSTLQATLLRRPALHTHTHVPTAESNHSPKLVNATITASIQYCERIACPWLG